MNKEIVPIERIAASIYFLRGQRVMLDYDLAGLYGVATKVLNQAVKRNRERFPNDFMFQLSPAETRSFRLEFVTTTVGTVSSQEPKRNWSQIVTSSRARRGITYRPYAFTEQGVAMLSSILKSKRAVKVNVAIMRAFVKLRGALETNRDLARKFAEMEKRIGKHDQEIHAILEAIRELMALPEEPRREIGFHVRETAPRYRTRKS
jgi:ORF6N domain